MIGAPSVITKTVDGQKMEPFERVEARAPEEYIGSIIDILGQRKGSMLDMSAADGEGFVEVRYLMPTRGLLGVRSQMLTVSRGTAMVDSTFDSFQPFAGDMPAREKGSLLAFDDGVATPFAMVSAQERGLMMIEPKIDVYRDMIVGIHQRPGDLRVNVCKMKQLTNMRSSGSDNTVKVVPPVEVTLESAVEYIAVDELIEVTPSELRMCKKAGWDKKTKK